MAHSKAMLGALALVFAVGGMAPAYSQGVLDRMKEDAARRAENKAVRDAESPAPAKQADAAAPAAAAPAAAPAAPAAPAAVAQPAAPVQPATPAQ